MKIKRVKQVKSTYGIRVTKEVREKLTALRKSGIVLSWLFEEAVLKTYQEEIGQFLPNKDGVSEAELKVLRAMERAENEKPTKLDFDGFGDDETVYDPNFTGKF